MVLKSQHSDSHSEERDREIHSPYRIEEAKHDPAYCTGSPNCPCLPSFTKITQRSYYTHWRTDPVFSIATSHFCLDISHIPNEPMRQKEGNIIKDFLRSHMRNNRNTWRCETKHRSAIRSRSRLRSRAEYWSGGSPLHSLPWMFRSTTDLNWLASGHWTGQ